MSFLAILIFSLCCWCVFSRHFCDGIVTKQLLSLSAIFSAIVAMHPENMAALGFALIFLMAGFVYWFIKHHRLIHDRARLMRRK